MSMGKTEKYVNLEEYLKRNLPFSRSPHPGQCPNDGQIIDYLEANLTKREKKEMQMHLSECASCLERVIATDQLLHELRSEGLLPKAKGRSLFEVLTGITGAVADAARALLGNVRSLKPAYRWAGAAVGIIVICFALFHTFDQESTSIITREPSVEQLNPQVEIIGPVNRGSVDSAQPEFRWSGPQEISSYAFILLDASGEIIWEITTTDTIAKLPENVPLKAEQTYFWQVEGCFADGESVLSEMVNFIYTTK